MNSYRTDDAETIVVAMGSVLGTIKDAVDRGRETGERIGVVGITSLRPFPSEAVCDALSGARQVVVIEKALSIGHGGVLATDVAMAMHNIFYSMRSVAAGLGRSPRYEVDLDFCKGCGIYVSECPRSAIDMVPERI